ncbi:MAG: TMEM175 family protein [Actinomycetota bacterium]|nr:TMEM175 family protein [Actinomycetota bacterium]
MGTTNTQTVEDDERGDGGVGLGRMLALSDGIFAIAMTLLAFQIQPPDLHGNDVHRLARALGHLGDRYYVYVLSFSVIGGFWLAHHRLFRHVERADEALMLINLVFLMIVAALPFPSAVLGRYGGQRAAVVLYASTMTFAGILMLALTVVAERRRLLAPTTTAAGIRRGIWRAGTMAGVFALSIPIAIAAPSVAPYSWIAILPLRTFPGVRRGLVKKRSH